MYIDKVNVYKKFDIQYFFNTLVSYIDDLHHELVLRKTNEILRHSFLRLAFSQTCEHAIKNLESQDILHFELPQLQTLQKLLVKNERKSRTFPKKRLKRIEMLIFLNKYDIFGKYQAKLCYFY